MREDWVKKWLYILTVSQRVIIPYINREKVEKKPWLYQYFSVRSNMKKTPSNIELIPAGGMNRNQKKFGRRIQQLDHILMDSTYLTGSTYSDFISSMYRALTNGRKITPKMEASISKIVKTYAKHINPEHQKTRLEYIEKTLDKIHSIRSLLDQCDYTSDYRYGKDMFLDSIENQVKQRAYLSQKQRVYLNKFHTQFTKKLKKSQNKAWLYQILSVRSSNNEREHEQRFEIF